MASDEPSTSTPASRGKVFGHIEGIPVYHAFPNRKAVYEAGVHVLIQGGIHGDPNEGAYSICVSESYYDDNKDFGDKIIYVGSGGKASDERTQIANQSFETPPNRALVISCETKRPVRVVRGKNNKSFYSPKGGFRYDGLYVVDKAEMKRGEQGYQMCTFTLRRIYEEGVGNIPTRRLLTGKTLNNMMKNAAK